MAVVRGGYTVLPHVQAFADACQKATGADSYGTYARHQPTPQRALDIFHSVNDTRLAQAVSDFYVAHWREFGGDYIIDRQRIWNPEISLNWRLMENRGGVTQNHFDHNHVSFEATASGLFVPTPQEDPELFKRTDSRIFNPPMKNHLVTMHTSRSLLGAEGVEPRKGAPLEVYPADGGRDQRWFIWWHSGEEISLVCQDAKDKLLAVDIPGSNAQNGVRLQLWDFNETAAQRFQPLWVGDDVLQLKHKSGLVLDIEGAGHGPGVILWSPGDGPWQRWLLVPTI